MTKIQRSSFSQKGKKINFASYISQLDLLEGRLLEKKRKRLGEKRQFMEVERVEILIEKITLSGLSRVHFHIFFFVQLGF